jgi:hypothetical protein
LLHFVVEDRSKSPFKLIGYQRRTFGGELHMSRNKITDQVWQDVLSRLALRPKLRAAARAAGISEASLFLKLRSSDEDPAAHQITWLAREDSFSNHVRAAKKIFLLDLDRGALELAMFGHQTPKYFSGAPVWVVDEQAAADSKSNMFDFEWEDKYPGRTRDDIYARTPDGKLIQAMDTSPPNPMLLNKVLASYLPQIYSERIEHEHHVSGGVFIEGRSAQAQLAAPGAHDNEFGAAIPADRLPRPTNILAIPQILDKETFDKKWMKPLVRDCVLFRDASGKLLAPIAGEEPDVVVVGTPQHRAFIEAGIEVAAVHPQTLLEQGFRNDFLFELCPDWKAPPKPKAVRPTDEEREAVAQQVAAKVAKQEIASTVSLYEPQEKIGKGVPPVGGFKVQL